MEVSQEDAKRSLTDLDLRVKAKSDNIVIDGTIMSRTAHVEIENGAIDVVAKSFAKAADEIRTARTIRAALEQE